MTQQPERIRSNRRPEAQRPGFARQLFGGEFRRDLLEPFPEQDEQDKKIGDEFIAGLETYLEQHLDADKVDATRTIPDKVMKELKARGVFAMKIGKEYGGLGFSQVNYNRTMMMISSHCNSTSSLVSAHLSIGVPQPLKMFGTAAQKEKYLPRLSQGAISAFALTEPDAGSDPANMTTRAELSADGSHYLLNGEKLWITNGTIADVLVVMAQTTPKVIKGKERKQVTAFIVETDTPGFEVVHRCDFMGIRAIRNGLLRFKDVKVPVENMLGNEGSGLKIALVTLNTGRLTIPAASTGMAKQCLSIVRRWGNERSQWGSPVIEHEAYQSQVAKIAATTFAIEAVMLLTSHWADRPETDIRVEAAMAKLFCSNQAWDVIDKTIQLRGGRGYETASSLKERGEIPYPIERMMRDCRIHRIVEGTDEIMRLFLAREALDPHLKRIAPILKGKIRFDTMKTIGIHYAGWYPKQWVDPTLFTSYQDMGILGQHLEYIERSARRLSRGIFHAIVTHKNKLEKRQRLLGRLVDIGTELFAMAATCAYAEHLSKKHLSSKGSEHSGSYALADVFCEGARQRIENSFSGLSHNHDRKNSALSSKVARGDLKWLEHGVLWVGPRT